MWSGPGSKLRKSSRVSGRDANVLREELLELAEGAVQVGLEGRAAVLAQHLLGEVEGHQLALAQGDGGRVAVGSVSR